MTGPSSRRFLADVPPTGPIAPLQKAALAWEVVRAYVRALRWLRLSDPRAMAARARREAAMSSHLPPATQRDLAVRLGWIVARVFSKLPTDTRCLVTSLTLSRLLARRGIEHTLVIGVNAKPEFAAHAWIEHEGLPVLPSGRFERLLEV